MDSQLPGFVYVPSRGWFHPIKDFETIKWAYEFLRRYSKGFRTRCINEFLDKNEDALEKAEAYELLSYMRSQVTQKQRDKRKQSQLITEARSERLSTSSMLFLNGLMKLFMVWGRPSFTP